MLGCVFSYKQVSYRPKPIDSGVHIANGFKLQLSQPILAPTPPTHPPVMGILLNESGAR